MRRYFAAQALSQVGSWMQSVAMSWLVYRLTGEAVWLGVTTFLQQLPVFLFSTWAGSLADRLPRRRIVVLTQTNALVQAGVLALLTFSGAVRPWHLPPLAMMLGLSHAFEIPARHALLAEIAGEDVPNAVALNSTLVNTARLAGPALAGLLVAWAGEAWCFLLNALSFALPLWALLRMRVPPHVPHAARGLGHLLEGLAYARDSAMIRALLLLALVASLTALPYQTLMPLVASRQLGGGAALLGQLLSSAGAGALAGAVVLLVRRDLGGLARRVGVGAALMALGLLGLSFARAPWAASAALACVGFGFITHQAGTMTLLQGLAPLALRGRVMGLLSLVFIGTVPFGALAFGALANRWGAAPVLRVGGLLALLSALRFHLALPGLRERVAGQHPTLPEGVVP